MVKSTSSTATILTTLGTTPANNNSDQQQHNDQATSWHRLQTSELSTQDLLTKTNVERLKHLDKSPLFVYPHRICFYLSDSSCFRQEVKLINPYEWRIHFQVLATVLRRYEVSPAKGSVGPNRTVDVSIRLLDTSFRNIVHSDVLRFQVFADDFTGMGSRYLPIQFSNNKTEYDEYKATFNNVNTESSVDCNETQISRDTIKTITNKQPSTSKSDTQGAASNNSPIGQNKPKPDSWPPSIYVVIAVFCGIILCLPNESENKLPTFMSVSTTPKFIAAYILGILTSLICKI